LDLHFIRIQAQDMGTWERISRWLLFGFQDTQEKRIESRVLLINFMSVLFVIITLCFAFFFLLNSTLLIGSIQALSSIFFTLNFIYFIRSKNYNGYAYAFVTLVSILFVASIVLYDLGAESGLIWLYFIPPIAFFLLGRKPGTIFSIVILFIASVLLWAPEHPMNTLHYSFPFKIHFTAVFLLLLIILYGYDSVQNTIINKLKKSREISANANRTKEEFISKLSHQIRTPLNDIVVLGELLNTDRLNKNQKDLVETIIASTNNLVNVVNSITEDSGIEITYQKKEHIKFDLQSTITSIMNLISRKAPSGFVLKQPSFEQVIPYLMGDPIILKQILLYVFDTIIKCHPGGALTVDMKINHERESDKSVELKFDISVTPKLLIQMPEEETGSQAGMEGVSREVADKFDISMTRKLIEEKGGALVYDCDEEFSRFSFTIPFDKPPRDETIPVTKEKVVSIDKFKKPPKIELKQSNLLLVEDNLINQKIVVLSLKELVRNIDLARDGKEALEKFGTSKYDVILMDIQMPVMDGIVTTKKIREIEASTNSHTPIIAITANAMLGDRETCLSAGMDDYISKPIQIEELVQKIKILLT